jgi:hypothetical protein
MVTDVDLNFFNYIAFMVNTWYPDIFTVTSVVLRYSAGHHPTIQIPKIMKFSLHKGVSGRQPQLCIVFSTLLYGSYNNFYTYITVV